MTDGAVNVCLRFPTIGRPQQLQCRIGGDQFHDRGWTEGIGSTGCKDGLRSINLLHKHPDVRQRNFCLAQGIDHARWQLLRTKRQTERAERDP